jgi:hypothetical protein
MPAVSAVIPEGKTGEEAPHYCGDRCRPGLEKRMKVICGSNVSHRLQHGPAFRESAAAPELLTGMSTLLCGPQDHLAAAFGAGH